MKGKNLDFSIRSLNTAILLQPIQFILNLLIFISIFIVYYDADPVSALYGENNYEFLASIIVLSIGVLNIVICFADPRCRKTCK